MNELIIVKQLPIIEEHLMVLKAEIEEKASRAMNLVCTEDTVKDVKAVRSDLNKEFEDLEKQRGIVKKKVLEPYEAFEQIYKDCVSSIYKQADKDLKKKIDEVEDTLKKEKIEKVIEYFNEYAQCMNVDFVTYEKANIKVGLSDSMKSLKDQAKKFIDKICDDLDLIKTQDHGDEILVEYEKSLNASQAITMVVNRKKALEAKKESEAVKAEEQQKVAEQVKQIDKIVELSAPVAKPVEAPLPRGIEEKQYKAVFEVVGSLDQLKAVKAFLEQNGVKYVTK